MRAAADWNTLLLATFRLAFHTGTDGTINRGPHLFILQEGKHIGMVGRSHSSVLYPVIQRKSNILRVRIMSLFSLNQLLGVHFQLVGLARHQG